MGETVSLYHEKQVAALCGQHCLNALLQRPFFTEIDLAQIAQELDAMEQSFMAQSGVDTKDYKDWQREASGNVAEDGMFSIQVLSYALQNWNLSCTSLYSPDCASSLEHPENEVAFICNQQEHWLTIRRIGGSFYNFNSLYPAPEFLGTLYLSAFLESLKEKGYSIFVVKGEFPKGNFHPSECPGRWFTPEEAKQATKQAVNARETGYLKATLGNIFDKASKGSSVMNLKPSGESAWSRKRQWEAQWEDDSADDDLAKAIAESLGHTSGGDRPMSVKEDAQLAGSSEPSTSAPQPEESSNLASLDPGPEPAAGPGVLGIAFRLPNGERLIRRFQASDSVQHLHNFLAWRGVADIDHLSMFPNKVIEDKQKTLQAAGISNMETLTVRPKA